LTNTSRSVVQNFTQILCNRDQPHCCLALPSRSEIYPETVAGPVVVQNFGTIWRVQLEQMPKSRATAQRRMSTSGTSSLFAAELLDICRTAQGFPPSDHHLPADYTVLRNDLFATAIATRAREPTPNENTGNHWVKLLGVGRPIMGQEPKIPRPAASPQQLPLRNIIGGFEDTRTHLPGTRNGRILRNWACPL